MSEWHREYKYLHAVPGATHADYLDADIEHVEAMIRISDAYAEAEQRENKRNNG
jgi:hypothetical protein